MKKKAIMAAWEGKTTPHIIIEVNQRCNISCEACYKNLKTYSKSFEQIKKEIDFAFSQRNLSSVTLAGGEPSLHPEINKIIAYCVQKGAVVNMLSNGVNLTDDTLAAYKTAGLSVIHVHVDSHQNRPDALRNSSEKELHAIREEITGRIKKHGMVPCISLTLYQSTLPELPDIVDFICTSDCVMGALVTLYADSHGLSEKFSKIKPDLAGIVETSKSLPHEQVTNEEVAKLLFDKFQLSYDFYVASNKSESRARWITYTVMSVSFPNGKYLTLQPSNGFLKFMNADEKLYHAIHKKYRFMADTVELKKFHYYLFIIFSGLMSFSVKYIAQAMKFFLASRKKGAAFTFSNIYFQQLAAITEDGTIEMCKSCPDATVRNGMIMPVCMADILSPISENENNFVNDAVLQLGLTFNDGN
ncbi:MAG: radical SAM protein [bacterium]|nr:radical SAM protein [bacterium]